MKPEPLTDAELERLSAILERFGGKRSMNLEKLDGFIAALVCGPDIILPSEYLPEIWGDDIVLEDTFAAQPILQDFLSLILRHWNVIADTLHTGEVYLPLLLEDESGISQPTIGQTVSCAECIYAKTIGLFSWMIWSMADGSYRFLRWRTNTTSILECAPTRTQLARKSARN